MTTAISNSVEDFGLAAVELPEGWALARAGERLNLTNGFPFKPSHWKGSGLPIIRIQNLNNPEAPFNFSPDHIPEKYRIKNGDLLFAWSGTPGTSFGAHIWLGGNAWLNQHIFRVNFDSELFDKQFLRLAINRNLDEYISQAQGGVGLAHITKRQFDASLFVLPPLPEQKRIVAKVVQLLVHVNSARTRLAQAPVILKRFRQAALAAACSGRLTADWRELHPQSESASDLLSKIAQLRSQTPDRTRRTANNRKSEHTKFDLPDCPDEWVWTTIQQVAEVRGGIQKQPKRAPKKNPYPYLRVANVLRDRLDLSEIHRMELFEGELETYRLERGDVLIVEGNGSLNEIGRSAIWAGTIENCVHQNHIIRVRACLCSPEYLNIYWNSPVGRANVAQVAVTTSGLYSLSTSKIANLPVAIPSLAEQQEIVRRVAGMFSLADAIEMRVAIATTRTEKLTQSILAKAFRGELVPTEAELARRKGRSYESASALLERILTESARLLNEVPQKHARKHFVKKENGRR